MTEAASSGSGADAERQDALEGRIAGQLRSLMTIAAAVSASRRFIEFLELAAAEACAVLGASSVSISRYERDEYTLRTLVNVGELAEWEESRPENEVYDLNDYPEVARCLEGGVGYLNVVDEEPGSASHALLVRLGKQSAVGVPIRVGGQTWGELYATTAEGARRFGPSDLAFLERVAEHLGEGAAEAQQVSRLDAFAYTDGLTGLSNRRGFEERLTAVCGQQGGRVALVLLDVDGLKGVNDHFGHEAGDALLAQVSTVLRETAATVDGATAHRLGGDEFCLLLPGRDSQTAERLARDAAARLSSRSDPVWVSCGVAAAATGELSGEELLRLADRAHYQAKRSGRGNVVVSTGASGQDAPNATPELARRATDVTRVLDRVLGCLDALPSACGAVERLEVTAAMLTDLLGLQAWVLWRASQTDDGASERTILDHGGPALTSQLSHQLVSATPASLAPRQAAIFEARLLAGETDPEGSFCLMAARDESATYGLTLAAGEPGVFGGLTATLRLLALAAVRGSQT